MLSLSLWVSDVDTISLLGLAVGGPHCGPLKLFEYDGTKQVDIEACDTFKCDCHYCYGQCYVPRLNT